MSMMDGRWRQWLVGGAIILSAWVVAAFVVIGSASTDLSEDGDADRNASRDDASSEPAATGASTWETLSAEEREFVDRVAEEAVELLVTRWKSMNREERESSLGEMGAALRDREDGGLGAYLGERLDASIQARWMLAFVRVASRHPDLREDLEGAMRGFGEGRRGRDSD